MWVKEIKQTNEKQFRSVPLMIGFAALFVAAAVDDTISYFLKVPFIPGYTATFMTIVIEGGTIIIGVIWFLMYRKCYHAMAFKQFTSVLAIALTCFINVEANLPTMQGLAYYA